MTISGGAGTLRASPDKAAAELGGAGDAAAPANEREVSIFQGTALPTLQKLLKERQDWLIERYPDAAECIKKGAVWLGKCSSKVEEDDWANIKKLVEPGIMHTLIVERAKRWTDETHIHHPLADFFEKNSTKGGYKVKAGWEFDVVHIWPRSGGGWSHPRNYAIMSSSLNRSLQDVYDEKMALFEKPIARKIVEARKQMQDTLLLLHKEAVVSMISVLPRI